MEQETTIVDVRILLEAFLNISLRYAFFFYLLSFFLVKGKIFGLGTEVLKVSHYQDPLIVGRWMKGILLYTT